MKYRHVFPIAGQWSFRLSLPGRKFVCEERWSEPQDCAFCADLSKLYLVRRFAVKGSGVLPSLPLDELKAFLAEAGIDSHNINDVFSQLPESFRVFIQDGGGELITEWLAQEKEARKKGFADL